MWVKVIACELYAVLHSQAGVRSKGIFCGVNTMSALPPKADMCGATRHVRYSVMIRSDADGV
jgi:hypothetical protein